MLVWNIIHFAGMVFQIAAALAGGWLAWSWLRVKNNNLEVSPERARQVKRSAGILLWVLAVGFLLELFYEIHLFQIS